MSGSAFIWTIFIFGLVLLIAGVWMFADAWDRMGLTAAIAWAVGFLFFPPIVFVYFLMLGIGTLSGSFHTRVAREDEQWFGKYASSMRTHREDHVRPLTRKELDEIRNLRLPERVEDFELDDRIEEFLKAGRHKEAVAYAKEMLEMARELKDASQIRRYEKYVFLLQLGPLRGNGV